ncbi:DUF721 domain-containing protein [Meridianimarinicoccus roseus]|jgi:hypothetical protein|uniref:DUF721 domain-containing protein n=1 Tax=Meridianimarinicoccus roseus TaxID=2072018 RepID=A0A2V2LKK9_9RHOB|nr:DUF721 domain-containing protein [Meridianimarinicoccus roseus]PWR02839.1 DUF721 domain-containing protein [Meridianimarinicoccus roseus]
MAKPASSTSPRPQRRAKGFARAGGLVQPQIRKAGEARGFAVSRLLTHWAEVAGPEIARLCRPVRIGYGKGGLGATLTLLARGAAGPMVQAQLPAIRDRVNACYGYNAVARIRVTQTAESGFAEGQTPFDAAPPRPAAPSPQATQTAADLAQDVTDPALRAALAGLGARVMSRNT